MFMYLPNEWMHETEYKINLIQNWELNHNENNDYDYFDSYCMFH